MPPHSLAKQQPIYKREIRTVSSLLTSRFVCVFCKVLMIIFILFVNVFGTKAQAYKTQKAQVQGQNEG